MSKVFDKQFRFNVDVTKSEGEVDGDFFVEGYASTSDLDRQGDIILTEALQAAAKDLEEINNTVFYGHSYDLENAVGKIVKVTVDDVGLRTKIYVSKWAKELRTKLKEGIISKYSIGGRVLQDRQIPKSEAFAQGVIDTDVPFDQINIIEGIELFEVSFVGVPANAHAQVVGTFAKALNSAYNKARGEGQGVGGTPQGDGGADKCVCPDCGKEIDHIKGKPCAEVKCPECGTLMQGKSNKENKAEGGVGVENEKPKEEIKEKTSEEVSPIEAPKEEVVTVPEVVAEKTVEESIEVAEKVEVMAESKEVVDKETPEEAPKVEEKEEAVIEVPKEKEPEEAISEAEIKELIEEKAEEEAVEVEAPKEEEVKDAPMIKLLNDLTASIKELSSFIRDRVKTIEISAEKKSVVKDQSPKVKKEIKVVDVDEEFLGLIKGDTDKL